MATSPQLPAEARANAEHCRGVATYIDIFLLRALLPFNNLPPSSWGGRSRAAHDTRLATVRDKLSKSSMTMKRLADAYDSWARTLDSQMAAEADAASEQASPPVAGQNPFSPFGGPY